jgi:hypothetical protein
MLAINLSPHCNCKLALSKSLASTLNGRNGDLVLIISVSGDKLRIGFSGGQSGHSGLASKLRTQSLN